MFEFRRQNRKKIAQCTIERITPEMEDQYTEMGDASPLYRLVYSVQFHLTHVTQLGLIPTYIADTLFELQRKKVVPGLIPCLFLYRALYMHIAT